MMKPPLPTKPNKKVSLQDIVGSEIKTVSFPGSKPSTENTNINNRQVENPGKHSGSNKVKKSPLIDQDSL